MERLLSSTSSVPLVTPEMYLSGSCGCDVHPAVDYFSIFHATFFLWVIHIPFCADLGVVLSSIVESFVKDVTLSTWVGKK